MNAEKLAEAIRSPETAEDILSGYVGPYSLGVGLRNGRIVVLLRVKDATGFPFPEQVVFDQEVVPVVVEGGFASPSPTS